jgi:hypothetical protein
MPPERLMPDPPRDPPAFGQCACLGGRSESRDPCINHAVIHYFKRLTMIDLTFGDSDFYSASFSDLTGI